MSGAKRCRTLNAELALAAANASSAKHSSADEARAEDPRLGRAANTESDAALKYQPMAKAGIIQLV